MPDSAAKPSHVEQTTCCIVGGGPAGMILAYLLARNEIKVHLFEAHHNFDREFRGDTVHPPTLELFDQLGLADELLALPHTKVRRMRFRSGGETFVAVDFNRLKSKYPFIALIPQVHFLDFLAAKLEKLPSARIELGANVRELIFEGDRCVGLRYPVGTEHREVRADLVVAADGRHSILRNQVGFEQKSAAAPMDVLWFTLPKSPKDAEIDEGIFRADAGRLTISLNRGDHWQIAYVIPKGGFHRLKSEGIEHFRDQIRAGAPDFADRVGTIESWQQVAVLNVEAGRLPCWHKPGLLFIGDASHTMSPVGGVGINYAIQDAVEAANQLTEPLRQGSVSEEMLASVQKRREGSVRFIQAVQSMLQRKLVAEAIDAKKKFRPPIFMRIGLLQGIFASVLLNGLRPSRLRPELAR